jgi:molybdate transport system ATP-binding protein
VHVSFNDVPILRDIHWTISKGEFWQLKGANGSGKTTLLSMITGENNKGYGQELYLFGNKKGSGETIWNIKKHLGYYSPTLTHNFKGHHSIEQMLISGLTDSIGLYQLPTEQQIYLADQWLSVLNMKSSKNTLFSDLTVGHQRLVMVARAMIKQPLVLLLDEPTENLDDESAMLFVSLINKIAKESTTSILYVSHRKEEALEPQFIYELQKTDLGSVGLAVKI